MRGVIALILSLASFGAFAQFKRYTYHDTEKKVIKEVYQVKDTIQNILNGRYISYFLNGNIESKGQFVNNETSGVWEFFYETGNIKMRGILRQNSNYGLWEYFYENGQKSMEGNINNRLREGLWKIYYESGDLKESGSYAANMRSGLWRTYFQDGTLRGEIEYTEDHGRYTEYYHSGKVLAEGPKAGVRHVGHWRYFTEAGTLESEGDFAEGKRNGLWKHYYASGKVSSEGMYENDEPVGIWNYYFEDGALSASGEYKGGKKNGYWNVLAPGGKKKSEINYVMGSGEYREYYTNGKLRVKGKIEDGKSHGLWSYYTEEGRLEGECDFAQGTGIYRGYYASGSLQTKGTIENDLRIGTWELYEEDGKLSGYYKPVYENNILVNASGIKATSAEKKESRKGFTYFDPRFPEYRGVIVQGNPALSFVGILPMAVEFYNEERLGHEFEFVAIRDPFYTADQNVAKDQVFNRGYAIAIKQKFYNPMKTGMWYFAHEVRFTNLGYFANTDFPLVPGTTFTASASEQRAEYGVLLGVRLMQRNNGDGFTIDAFTGYGLGYRGFDVEPRFESIFDSVNQNKFVHTLRLGISFGYSLSFGGRR
ncbi:MAG: toxin-antitoxin system YwqK family antitoxin [Cyclobacteriaceae bacterium]|nr:toxin-antitoxin system YwqK family antitoxin [Cyclobacteriaceae bacterium]